MFFSWTQSPHSVRSAASNVLCWFELRVKQKQLTKGQCVCVCGPGDELMKLAEEVTSV